MKIEKVELYMNIPGQGGTLDPDFGSRPNLSDPPQPPVQPRQMHRHLFFL